VPAGCNETKLYTVPIAGATLAYVNCVCANIEKTTFFADTCQKECAWPASNGACQYTQLLAYIDDTDTHHEFSAIESCATSFEGVTTLDIDATPKSLTCNCTAPPAS